MTASIRPAITLGTDDGDKTATDNLTQPFDRHAIIMKVESRERESRAESRIIGLRSPFSPSSTPHSASARRGLTLIELLVVIIILTTLVAAAIPIMAPTNDDRRLREATRGLNTFISAAQMRADPVAAAGGRRLKRLAQDTNRRRMHEHEDNAVCIELFYVEQPAAVPRLRSHLGGDGRSASGSDSRRPGARAIRVSRTTILRTTTCRSAGTPICFRPA